MDGGSWLRRVPSRRASLSKFSVLAGPGVPEFSPYSSTSRLLRCVPITPGRFFGSAPEEHFASASELERADELFDERRRLLASHKVCKLNLLHCTVNLLRRYTVIVMVSNIYLGLTRMLLYLPPLLPRFPDFYIKTAPQQ
jgi:hypothetical protein